jgi:hypothetical protein
MATYLIRVHLTAADDRPEELPPAEAPTLGQIEAVVRLEVGRLASDFEVGVSAERVDE